MGIGDMIAVTQCGLRTPGLGPAVAWWIYSRFRRAREGSVLLSPTGGAVVKASICTVSSAAMAFGDFLSR